MPERLPLGRRPNRSLVLASIELGRLLADRNGTTFKAKGICMYPTIRAGDILRIRSCSVADVALGDIAVCRRSGYMSAHRVIRKGECNDRAYIVTRPDNIMIGDDGPTFLEDFLGIVITIERHGRQVPLAAVPYSRPTRIYLAINLFFATMISEVMTYFSDIFAKIQESRSYTHIAERLFMSLHPHITYTVRLPMLALGDAAYRQMTPEAFDVEADWRGRPVKRWSLVLYINDNAEPAAWTTFIRDSKNQWHIEEAVVEPRYRGTGVLRLLEQKGLEILQRSLVLEDNADTILNFS